MTLHDRRGVATWFETTRKAQALDEIAYQIARAIAPDNIATDEDLVAKIIAIIETRTNYVFIACVDSGQDNRRGEFHMTAAERQDEAEGKPPPQQAEL